MGTYSSYYLYQKFQIIGNQDPIPVIPLTYSVSGDSLDPQPLVEKLENDPKCGYVPPVEYQYRDIESGYTCVDYDKYTKVVRQRSSDGIHWENVSYSAGTLIEHNSTDCGYVGELYRWVNSGTTCYEGDKYIRIIQQVSYDGINWTNTGQEARGTMIEADSPDCIEYRWVNMDISTDYICDECPDVEYRWTATTGYVCSGTTKMTKEIEQVSYDSGTTWQNVVPEVSRATLPVIEYDSEDCGYIQPQYRTLSTATTCIGYDKYTLEEYQVSYDSGVTWTTTGTSATTLIEADSPDCGYIPPHDYSKEYLTFIPISGSSTFGWITPTASTVSANTVYYSLNSGSTWNSLSSGQTITVNAGNKILWKGTLTPGGANSSGSGRFDASANFYAEGNIMSLLYGDNFENQTDLTGKYNVFLGLFSGNTNIISAENLVLPATTLADYCYANMFYGCTSLTTAPSILPATTLQIFCYQYMFMECTSLTTAPELPATTLAIACYGSMFRKCTNLITAPELPATTLYYGCYQGMFLGCTSLNSITCLATNISASNCTDYWVDGVAANGTFTKASTMTSWSRGANGIPSNWTVQNY